MAKLGTFTFSQGFIEASPSKERWSPGDPLPWKAAIVDGLPCANGMTGERMQWIRQEFKARPDDAYIVTYPKSG